MTTSQQINSYVSTLPAPKRAEMQQLHERILKLLPGARLWFHDGTNVEGKVVSNNN
ncbi:hypothetical protein [Flavobacterium album]|uniref:hypothetical protein n=1 Tax=Flavobacterium album TaxID=2175091 RepID=UPI0015E7F3C7|nr:hypothetical protein [Flavobacterium album]